ncbi:transposase [Alkalihalobacterium alkalinitrilicum]|uniref:transposase n=1 Tax=Alkalihalobacterium alkalinitrilicum TaxID=427920 RepID=UPI001153B05A|nr:transposase [Alkalihalobacterium alkalinitrilicum]
MKKTIYSEAFKKKLAQEAMTINNMSKIARRYEVSVGLIYKWVEKTKKGDL